MTLKPALEIKSPIFCLRSSSFTLSSLISSLMELERILPFFENKTILVTGATGFLAKGSLSLSVKMHILMFV